MITIASENAAANRSAVPKMAPMRSVYFATYAGTWSAGAWSAAWTAVPSIRMMSRPMSVTSRPQSNVGVGGDVAQLRLRRLAVDQDGVVVAKEEPHRNHVGAAGGAHRRQPRHQVGLQAAVDPSTPIFRKVSSQSHAVSMSVEGHMCQVQDGPTGDEQADDGHNHDHEGSSVMQCPVEELSDRIAAHVGAT